MMAMSVLPAIAVAKEYVPVALSSIATMVIPAPAMAVTPKWAVHTRPFPDLVATATLVR
jgi:hypothetical protein